MSIQIEQIKERLDIVDFIKQHIELQPAGANFKALCPFHQEDTPSFMISPAKQIFKCFGCGKGGDIFTFLQELEGIEFGEALKMLANKAGVELPKFDKQANTKKNRLCDVLKAASQFYHNFLVNSPLNSIARQYIDKRGIKEIERDIFLLGLSPQEWEAVYQALRKKGFSEMDIVQSGLVSKGQRGYFDRFRGRLMFPIWDVYGRVVGFGGRVLVNNKQQAKYINTPQTDIYNKSCVLYGLDKAKEAIRKQGTVVVVEGYLDVIASHSAGVKNVVAASGTALTTGQLQLLKRFTTNVILAFDADNAGIQAAIRSYHNAVSLGMNTKIVRILECKDPDELVKKDINLWKQAISSAQHVVDYYFAIILQDLDITNIEHKKRARDLLMPLIVSITDSVERNHFLDKLAVLLKVDSSTLLSEFKKNHNQIKSRQLSSITKTEVKTSKKDKQTIKYAVQLLLALMLAYPAKIPKGQTIKALFFRDESLNSLYKLVTDAYNTGKLTKDAILKWKSTYADIVEDLLLLNSKEYSALEPYEIEHEFVRLVIFLDTRFKEYKQKRIVADMRLAEAKGNDQKVLELAIQLDSLTKV